MTGRTAFKAYVAVTAAMGAWASIEEGLNPWQATATIVLSPAIFAAAVGNALRLVVFER